MQVRIRFGDLGHSANGSTDYTLVMIFILGKYSHILKETKSGFNFSFLSPPVTIVLPQLTV